ncbi:MAG: DsrE/DsrF/DrsH-like family protein [Balneolaceae bacterium]|jgi:peroxiredoxin family protein
MGKSKTQTLPNGIPKIKSQPIEKISIVISRGSLDGVYPGLIMANGARMEGIEVTLFFTFFGLEAITENKMDDLKVATVGNPAMHIPTLVGGLPGMSGFATRRMKRQMEELDIPPIREFIEMIHDSGADLYACKASVDMFGLTMNDFCPQVEDIISVGRFFELSENAQIIFT